MEGFKVILLWKEVYHHCRILVHGLRLRHYFKSAESANISAEISDPDSRRYDLAESVGDTRGSNIGRYLCLSIEKWADKIRPSTQGFVYLYKLTGLDSNFEPKLVNCKHWAEVM